MQVQLIIMLLVALVLILMTLQNPNPVSLQFLSWQARSVPLIVVMLTSLLLGAVVSSLLGLMKQSKLKEQIRRLQEEMDRLTRGSDISDKDELED